MKKILVTLSILFLFPLNILAYSTKVIPGGETIGININSNGLIVVGYYKINGKYEAKKYFNIGDSILKVNDKQVNTISNLVSVIEESKSDEMTFTIKRNDKNIKQTIKLSIEDGKYKTGIYVKESVGGIGTLTYIDPMSKIYGALGHEIALKDTKKKVDVRNGNIFDSLVGSIDRSSNGNVGSKNATILYDKIIGDINKNTTFGIYGKYTNTLPNKKLVEVAAFNEIEEGSAVIYTVLSSNKVNEYNIKIIGKDIGSINTTKAISFIIDDVKLIEKTGGVVQGMSGSPIIQNNKIIGAVTNVVIDNVTKGYAVFIETMLKEGERQ